MIFVGCDLLIEKVVLMLCCKASCPVIDELVCYQPALWDISSLM